MDIKASIKAHNILGFTREGNNIRPKQGKLN